MTKIKKVFLFGILMLFISLSCIIVYNGKVSKAYTEQADNLVYSSENKKVSTLGLYTKLTFSLGGGNGQVWFSAKNKFTLFPATVIVYLELYNSDTYQENYSDMTLVATNYTADLDQGKTLTAIYQTNGKQSYWKARTSYKIDNNDWQEFISETVLFNEHGVRA